MGEAFAVAVHAPTVVIAGAAGLSNLGDDAILAAMLAELRDALPEARLVVWTGAPERLAAEERVETIPFDDDAALAAALEGASLLVVGGGGFLFDHDSVLSEADFRRNRVGNFYPYFRAAEAAYARGVPVYFYGVGVGPLITPGGRQLARAVLSQAAAITVRDPISLGELAAAGVTTPVAELTADPAVGLSPSAESWTDRPAGRAVGFVVRTWAWCGGRWTRSGEAAYERYLDWLAGGADHAVERWEATPVFLPMQRLYDDDLEVEERVVARMRHRSAALVHEAQAPGELTAVVGSLDALVSTRLHPLILGAVAGVPLVGVTAKPKVRGFLVALGLAELALSPWAASEGALLRAIDRVLAEPDPVRRTIAAGLASQRAAAARNPEVAAALVGVGAGAA
jgi:polysaccharide pyruvyl transferase WcaK-like protein